MSGGVIKIVANDGPTDRMQTVSQLVASETLKSSKGMTQYKRINKKTAIEYAIGNLTLKETTYQRYST